MRAPSGLNAALVTAPSWPLSARSSSPLRGVPHPRRAVVGGGDDARPVGAERGAPDRAVVALELAQHGATAWRPTPARCRRHEAVTMRAPSGLNATLRDPAAVALELAPASSPLVASHTRAVSVAQRR